MWGGGWPGNLEVPQTAGGPETPLQSWKPLSSAKVATPTPTSTTLKFRCGKEPRTGEGAMGNTQHGGQEAGVPGRVGAPGKGELLWAQVRLSLASHPCGQVGTRTPSEPVLLKCPH